MSLEKTNAGLLNIDTLQKDVELDIPSVALEPKVFDCGGLKKEIEIYRLPDHQESCEFSFDNHIGFLSKPGSEF